MSIYDMKNNLIKKLRDVLKSFIPTNDIEAEDVSYMLARNYLVSLDFDLIDNFIYDKKGEMVAELMHHFFDGSNFEMKVNWVKPMHFIVADVMFDVTRTK